MIGRMGSICGNESSESLRALRRAALTRFGFFGFSFSLESL
jgi:hypothetical protein